jgi:hypothetical protein
VPDLLGVFIMHQPIQRRVFIMTLATATAAAGTIAQAQAALDEKDPQAVAMGYVADAKRADAKKFPKYAAGQVCANCALFQGKATDKMGGCPIFGAKQVAGAGWCNAYAKKA